MNFFFVVFSPLLEIFTKKLNDIDIVINTLMDHSKLLSIKQLSKVNHSPDYLEANLANKFLMK